MNHQQNFQQSSPFPPEMNGNTRVKYCFLKSGLEDSLSVIILFCITGFVSLDCAMNFFTVHGFFVQEEPHPHPSIHLKLASFFHKTTKNNKTKKKLERTLIIVNIFLPSWQNLQLTQEKFTKDKHRHLIMDVYLPSCSSLPSFVWFSVAIRLKFRGDTPRKNNKVQLLKDSSMHQVKN